MALELFPGSTWKQRRRRKRNVSSMSTDLAQRLNKSTEDLCVAMEEYSKECRHGLTLPVTALAWILILFESNPSDSSFAVLRKYHGQGNRRLARLVSFLQSNITFLRIVGGNGNGGESWPLESAHRDLEWPGFAHVNDARDWLKEYVQWQMRPSLTCALPLLFPKLTVLWLDRISLDHHWDTNIWNQLAPQLQVLRLENIDLQQAWKQGDFFQNAPSSTTMTTSLSVAIFTQLTHLKITHCSLPSTFFHQQPIWTHFPALTSLSLSHNNLASSSQEWMLGLSLLTNLNNFDISHNHVQPPYPENYNNSLSQLHLHLGNLVEINLAFYGLTSCAGVDRLYSLERLFLHGNLLPDLAAIRGLATLPQLLMLTLYDNPLSTITAIPTKNHSSALPTVNNKFSPYRLAVLDMFAQVRGNVPSFLPVLDRIAATQEEIEILWNMSCITLTPDPMYPINNHKDTPIKNNVIGLPATSPTHHLPQTGKRLRRVANIMEADKHQIRMSMTETPLTSRTPLTNFDAVDVLKSLCPLSPAPPPPSPPPRSPAPDPIQKEDLDGATNLSIASQATPETMPLATNLSVASQATQETMPVPLKRENPDTLQAVVTEDEPPTSNDDHASLENLTLSPIQCDKKEEKKMCTIVLHNGSSSPGRDLLDVSFLGSVGAASVASSRLITMEEDQEMLSLPPLDSTNALHSAMLLSFAVTSEQSWAQQQRGGGGDECSSLATSQISDDRRKYLLAEKNSAFLGPHMYKQIPIQDNLEIYFRLFVFSSSVRTDSSSNLMGFDPEENAWRSVLEQFPRIQLRPVDRRFQESEALATQNISLAAAEEFRRVWNERVVGCGKPSLQRLTPTRSLRRGFHGEIIMVQDQTNNMSQPDVVTRERKTILCCSTSAFYIIADHDAAPANNPPNKLSSLSKQRSFPRPIPKDACFAEAVWPHALARHPWTHLHAITIGFNFQRLTLHFNSNCNNNSNCLILNYDSPSSKAGSGEDFCYILLTGNKLQTISLLKEFQDLIEAADTNAGKETTVAIENDDPVVLDGLATSVGENNILGVVCHFQILHQYWKTMDRGNVRRVCVLTDCKIFLLDEDFYGDGSKEGAVLTDSMEIWGKPEYHVVDQADLDHIIAVEAESDPCSVTISIRPVSRLSRTHYWRLICRDREGAERLIDDVRKAAKSARR